MELDFVNFINLSDKELKEILIIRNSKYVSQHMRSSKKISHKDHFKWVKELQNNATKKYYAITHQNQITGAVYYTNLNLKKSQCVWGVYFQQDTNPIISSLATYIFLDYIFKHLDLKKISSLVKPDNQEALRFNMSFGFEKVAQITQNNEDYTSLNLSHERWLSYQETRVLKSLKKKLDKISYNLPKEHF